MKNNNRVSFLPSAGANEYLENACVEFNDNKSTIINCMLGILKPEAVALLKYVSEKENVPPYKILSDSLFSSYIKTTDPFIRKLSFYCLEHKLYIYILYEIFKEVELAQIWNKPINYNTLYELTFFFYSNAKQIKLSDFTSFRMYETNIKMNISIINQHILSYVKSEVQNNESVGNVERLFPQKELLFQISNPEQCSILEICMTINRAWDIILNNKNAQKSLTNLLFSFVSLDYFNTPKEPSQRNNRLCMELFAILNKCPSVLEK